MGRILEVQELRPTLDFDGRPRPGDRSTDVRAHLEERSARKGTG
jgi:hypothetical protein